MQPSSAPLCDSFKNRIGEISQNMDKWKATLDLYMQNPTTQVENQVSELAGQAYQLHDLFLKDYQDKTRELIAEWGSGNIDLPPRILFEDSGRVAIEGDLYCGRYSFVPDLIRKVNGNFRVSNTGVENADYIEEVGSIGMMGNRNFKSAKRLLRADGNADFSTSVIQELPALYEVVGTLDISACRELTSIPSLRKAEQINCGQTNFASFESLEECGRLLATGSKLKFLPRLRRGRDLELERTEVTELPELEEAARIRASNLPLSAPKLTTISHHLLLARTRIEDFTKAFPNLKSIGMSSKGDVSLETDDKNLKDKLLALKKAGQIAFKYIWLRSSTDVGINGGSDGRLYG